MFSFVKLTETLTLLFEINYMEQKFKLFYVFFI